MGTQKRAFSERPMGTKFFHHEYHRVADISDFRKTCGVSNSEKYVVYSVYPVFSISRKYVVYAVYPIISISRKYEVYAVYPVFSIFRKYVVYAVYL